MTLSPTRTSCFIAVLLFTLASFQISAAARAAHAGGKRVAVHVSGKDGARVEKSVAQALKGHGFKPAKPKEVSAAAKSLHTDWKAEGDVAALAKRLKVLAVVEGEVRDKGRRLELRAHGADGSVVGEGEWSAPGGSKKLPAVAARGVWAKLGSGLEDARPARGGKRGRSDAEAIQPVAEKEIKDAPGSASEPVPSSPPAEERAPAEERKPPADTEAAEERKRPADTEADEEHPARRRRERPAAEVVEASSDEPVGTGPAPIALDAIAGLRIVKRDLSWVKDTNQTYQPFGMSGAAAVGFQLSWYPAAHFTRGWPANLGIAASGEFVPSVAATTSDGASYPVSDSDYWAGVRGRLPLGPADFMLTVAGGKHAFVLHNGATSMRANLSVPDMQYTYVRAGLDARVRLPFKFSAQAGAAYRGVLSGGTQNYDLQSMAYFPKGLTVAALDVSASVGYQVLAPLEARVGFDFRRYGLDMHPQTSGATVSGAVDSYTAFWLGVAVLLDGKPGRSH